MSQILALEPAALKSMGEASRYTLKPNISTSLCLHKIKVHTSEGWFTTDLID